MKLKFITTLLLGVMSIGFGSAQNHPVIFSYLYLNDGDIYLGQIMSGNDTSYLFSDIYLGEIRVPKQSIKDQKDIRTMTLSQVELNNGTAYTGRFISIDSNLICSFQSNTDQIFTFHLSRLADVDALTREGITHGNPNATRYFFAPSAIPLKKGTGYYQNAYLLSNSANFGLTDNFTLGGGVIIPLLFYATPKVGFEVKKNFYLGAGFIAATTIIPDNIVSGGIPFALATYGNEEANITVGGGYGLIWIEGEYDHTQNPITTINGMFRLTNRLQLVSENWIIPYDQTDEREVVPGYFDPGTGQYVDPVYEDFVVSHVALALSLGMRIHINPRSTIDFAPVYVSTATEIVIPYLDYVYRF